MINQAKYFFIHFHSGAVNIILHLASIPVIFLGLMNKSILLIVAGTVMQEAGHIYNHVTGKHKYSLKLVPAQIILFILIIIPLMYLFGWFS